ncbi:SCO family protein [Ferrimonas marina]|uniref:SCO family protein n=1 Tax=Ferrimonas marina TaxID=299255 RepID=UPI0013562CF8|nr:SCO family protein [Ferrimonas marina]
MIVTAAAIATVLALCLLPLRLGAEEDPHAQHRELPADAPAYQGLGYTLPAAGSYRLPPIHGAKDGEVLLSTGEPAQLFSLYQGHYVVLSFIYTRCPDPNACPLASFVLSRLQLKLAQQPELAAQVRLITLSFDPQFDSPATMAAYGQRFNRPGAPQWLFATTSGAEQLAPILEDYNQWVLAEYDQQGNPTGMLSHLLRVYLIDPQRQVRNIYSTGFLHADVVLNDLGTLVLESQAAR